MFFRRINKMFVVLFIINFIPVSQSRVLNIQKRIIGGEKVSIERFSYQVSIRRNGEHKCGGAIINNNTIVTAGHCVFGKNYNSFYVGLGNTFHENSESLMVSKVLLHEKYDKNLVNYDVALLKLSRSLIFSKTVQPIPLQPKGVEVPPGTKAWVSGWGVTQKKSLTATDHLRATNVRVISNVECDFKYGKGVITNRMMCTQSLRNDACQGDSGGPLVANGRLIGIVSWGVSCADPVFPAVYANISDMNDWITQNSLAISRFITWWILLYFILRILFMIYLFVKIS